MNCLNVEKLVKTRAVDDEWCQVVFIHRLLDPDPLPTGKTEDWRLED